jgi:transcription factor IIIB subunit 2
MSQRCSLCSGETQWDDSANSVLCVDCGNLEDASQTPLVNGDVYDVSNYKHFSDSDAFGALTAPALRAASGRILAGQSSKGARDATNTRELHGYITSILRIVNHSSIGDRSTFLFDRAMQLGRFRWGKQATHTALACIMIAIRENHLGESLASVAVRYLFLTI